MANGDAKCNADLIAQTQGTKISLATAINNTSHYPDAILLKIMIKCSWKGQVTFLWYGISDGGNVLLYGWYETMETGLVVAIYDPFDELCEKLLLQKIDRVS